MITKNNLKKYFIYFQKNDYLVYKQKTDEKNYIIVNNLLITIYINFFNKFFFYN